jgi:LmbE family N-acetylglucosaminyl deacetylase
MAVHAHPDDEAISTGGVLAMYSAQGVRTVLVTCTDGGCGDGPGGIKPGDEGFDRDAVVAERQTELAHSCKVLGVTHLETLGYRDSGMMGWPQNDEPGSFWTTPLDGPTAQLALLMRRYQPDVVVTYNANGFYGHPDHIQAHRVTMAAVEQTGIPAKVYWTAVPRSQLASLGQRLREAGLDRPDAETPGQADDDGTRDATGSGVARGSEEEAGDDAGSGDPGPDVNWGTPDEEVTTWVDVSAAADRKFDSLLAHASQSDNIFFVRMGRQLFAELMGWETFVRAADRTGSSVPESDLFAGLR